MVFVYLATYMKELAVAPKKSPFSAESRRANQEEGKVKAAYHLP